MKTTDDYFRDWESHFLGFGYGSGEEHVTPALKRFMELGQNDGGSYDHRELERELGPVVAWLLVNLLCHADAIEYGTSPRFGWLTPHGQRLREYIGPLLSRLLQLRRGRPVQ
jgi:hypothetical protein